MKLLIVLLCFQTIILTGCANSKSGNEDNASYSKQDESFSEEPIADNVVESEEEETVPGTDYTSTEPVPAALPNKDCSDARSNLDDALRYLRRASESKEMDDAEYQARRAYRSISDAGSAANDCDCDDAYYALSEASSKARRAKNASELDELWEYVGKAARACNEAASALESCEEETQE